MLRHPREGFRVLQCYTNEALSMMHRESASTASRLGIQFLVGAFNSGVSKPPLSGGGDGFCLPWLQETGNACHSLSGNRCFCGTTTQTINDLMRTTRVGARELPPEQTGERDTVSLGTLFCPFFRSVAFSHVTNLSLTLSLSLSLSLFLSFFLFLFSGDRPGGGRGGRRESLADCSRSQRTANRKGLYIISS